MRRIGEIILHCGDFPTGWSEQHDALSAARAVHAMHLQRGWSGVGYHHLAMPSGEVANLRPFDMVGAHTKGRNTGSVGILLVEHTRPIRHDAPFLDHFSQDQRLAVLALIAAYKAIFPDLTVKGHNDYAAVLCPGFKVQPVDWLPVDLNKSKNR